ncbi:cohesin domain-containing protein [Pseudobacteroides cellulosolvens]|uniref:Cellulosome anchoring protein cohesin region n=1 Tax=Pseudobacteroides cellulosolvens ATCC 35603 = DSM 2933 TaxID=398512 RepID=A0A0L6JLX5_9FIRM|nr:cohesin domain-containing protein [Pseudobacteroides cellulosolvens]KNY26407.1 cellulosome anchoring protein cohesin region [Pseudobacteroides cellulosolvens ATCC 35603 = DSM 2933]
MKGKKAIVLLAVSFILTTFFSLSAFASSDTPVTVYGDFDNDGNFDSDDYALFRQFMLNMIDKEIVPATCDVDGNGLYNSDDYAYMRQHLLGMIKIFPVQSTLVPSPTVTPYVTPIITPTLTPVPTPTSTPVPTVQPEGLYISYSKEPLNMLKVTLNIKNIANFSGYQANLVYDPQVLRPVYSDGSEYDSQSPVEIGSLLTKRYIPTDFAKHDLQNGVLNFGRTYLAVDSYKNSGVAESSGSIAVIYFKILKYETTKIRLENCDTMPGALKGTIITDWDGNMILDYNVGETSTIPAYVLTSTPTPTIAIPSPTLEPDGDDRYYYYYW